MKRLGLLLSTSFWLLTLAAPAAASPSFDARLTNKGLLIWSSGGAASNCTLTIDVSQLLDGVRVTQHLLFQDIQPAQKAGPVVLEKFTNVLDLRIETPVVATCS